VSKPIGTRCRDLNFGFARPQSARIYIGSPARFTPDRILWSRPDPCASLLAMEGGDAQCL